MLLGVFPGATRTNDHKTERLKTTGIDSHNSGGLRTKTKAVADGTLSKNSSKHPSLPI
jgi:hypothetical protein